MSTSDQDPARDSARRKFDDVASLFGPIVPPAGSPVRVRTAEKPTALPQILDYTLSPEARPKPAPPPALRAPQSEIPPLPPKAEPLSVVPTPVPAERKREPLRFDLPPAARPLPDKRPAAERKTSAEVPWPDAFSPRPNYRSTRKSRLWYWVFLIPFAAVVAVSITLIDPRTIRTFIDQTLPQYIPAEVTQFFSRSTSTPARPDIFPPVQPPPESSAVSPPDPAPTLPPAAPTPPVVAEQPAPAEPASPAPTLPAPIEQSLPEAPPETPQAVVTAPPSTPSDPPALPEPAAPQAPATRVTIYYRRNQASAEIEARRFAAKAGNAEIKPSTVTARSPMIYYFNAADREAATALARTLAGTGVAGWIVRAGPTRPNPGAIDVLVP